MGGEDRYAAAGNGPLASYVQQAEQGDLRVLPGVALSCATACQHVIGRLLAYQSILNNDANIDNITHFGGLESGNQLAGKFNIKVTQVSDDLRKTIGTLALIVDLFKAAGAAYRKVDADVEDEVKRLARVTSNPGKADIGYKKPKYEMPDASGKPTMPPGMTSPKERTVSGSPGMETPTIRPENPDNLSPAQLETFKHNINPETPGQAGLVWRFLAKDIAEAVTDLNERLGTITADSWSGLAAAAARLAVSTYGGHVAEVAKMMDQIGINLDYTARYLAVTKGAMPATFLGSPWCDLDEAYDAFRDVYVPGILASDASLPILPPFPGEAPKPMPNPKGNGDGKGGSGGGNNGNGNGGNGNGGGGNGSGNGGGNGGQQNTAQPDVLGPLVNALAQGLQMIPATMQGIGQLTQLLQNNAPAADINALLAQHPAVRQAIAGNPELKPLADKLGIRTADTRPAEPTVASKLFPRAAVPGQTADQPLIPASATQEQERRAAVSGAGVADPEDEVAEGRFRVPVIGASTGETVAAAPKTRAASTAELDPMAAEA